MTDDQLIESLRARMWPGDCEAAAFRLEELRARVAELEALPGNVLAQGKRQTNPRKQAMKTIDELGWDDAGEATTLAAAAADADEWLALIERLHNNGRGPWKFSDPESAGKLSGCRASLHRFIEAELAKDQPKEAGD